MSLLELDESAWQLAKVNAAATYDSSPFNLAAAGVAVLTAAAAALVSYGGDAVTAVAVTIVAGLSGIFACLIVVLVFQVFAAPLRQRDELRRAWVTSVPPAAPDVGVMLSDFARRGDDFLASCRANGGYTSDDEKAVETWTADVVAFLAAYCDADAATEFTQASRGTAPFIGRLEKRIAVLDTIAGWLGAGWLS